MATRVRITNYYQGRTNGTVEDVPTPDDPTDLEDWWEDTVFPFTGDGKGGSEYALYEAKVIESDLPELLGLKYEWDG